MRSPDHGNLEASDLPGSWGQCATPLSVSLDYIYNVKWLVPMWNACPECISKIIKHWHFWHGFQRSSKAGISDMGFRNNQASVQKSTRLLLPILHRLPRFSASLVEVRPFYNQDPLGRGSSNGRIWGLGRYFALSILTPSDWWFDRIDQPILYRRAKLDSFTCLRPNPPW